MVFGTKPVREITVFFKAPDSAYAEVQRVLQMMIPEIRLTRNADVTVHPEPNSKTALD